MRRGLFFPPQRETGGVQYAANKVGILDASTRISFTDGRPLSPLLAFEGYLKALAVGKALPTL